MAPQNLSPQDFVLAFRDLLARNNQALIDADLNDAEDGLGDVERERREARITLSAKNQVLAERSP